MLSQSDIVILGDCPNGEDGMRLLFGATVEDVGGSVDDVYYAKSVDDIRDHNPKIVIAAGVHSVKALCATTRPLSKIQGAMHYNKSIESFVIPTYSAGAVLSGQKDSINVFDDIYKTIDRAVLICKGELALPDKNGMQVKWEFIGHDGERTDRAEWHTWSGYWEPPTPTEKVRALEVIHGWLCDLKQGALTLAVDTESRDLDFFNPMTMLQIYDGAVAYAFTWGVLADEEISRALRSVLMNPRTRIIFHNLSHDRKVLKYHMDLEFGERDDDTLCWGLGLTEKYKEVGLKYLSRQYLNAPYYEEELSKYFDPERDPWDMCPPRVLAEYGCYDVYNTYKLSLILPKLVEREGTADVVKNILIPSARTFADCEYRGIDVDTAYAKELEEQWVPMVDEAEQKIKDYAKSVGFPWDSTITASQKLPVLCPACTPRVFEKCGIDSSTPRASWRAQFQEAMNQDPSCSKCSRRRYLMIQNNEINVRSPKQLSHLAYDILGFSEGRWGRTTDKKFCQRNAGHDFIKLLVSFRRMDKLLNSFVRAISKFVRQDGRIHPSFLFAAVTGRLSIKDPAMQTVPKMGTDPVLAKMIRRLFPARSGYLIVDVDYANLEMFTLWHYSEDPALGKALMEQDFHTAMASAIFNVPYDEVTPELRNSGKPVTFGVGYGRTAWALAQGEMKEITNGSEEVCQQFIDNIWDRFPKWREIFFKWQEDAVTNGYLTSTLGRKRRWRLINKQNIRHVQNQASNFPSQSLASDLCLMSMNILNRELSERGWGDMLFPVHDALVMEIRKDKIHEAVELIERVMTTPSFETVAQFRVKVEVGPTLGDVEKYDPERVYV